MKRLGTVASKVLIGAIVVVVAILAAWLIGLNFGVMAVLVAVVLVGTGLVQFFGGRRRDRPAGIGRFVIDIVAVAAATFLVIQVIPVGREHANPAITGEPQWADPRARELMVSACFGCHSNEVVWPAYSNVAPLSWAITEHVDEGRAAVNYSEFDRPQDEADETLEVLLEQSMPPGYYTRFGLHPEANLSTQDRVDLIAWIRATPGLSDDDGGGDESSDVGESDDGDRDDDRDDDRDED